MSFIKSTIITGKTQSGEVKCLQPRGHWDIQKAIARGRKAGIVGEMQIKYNVYDMSGHGRSGHDGRWVVDAAGSAIKQSSWSEFGVEH